MTLWRLWKDRQLQKVERLLKIAISNQEKMMAILDELKHAVADIAADAMAAHEQVMVAIEHIIKEVDLESNPELHEAVDDLHDAHESFVETIKTLKDRVDEVMASGGPTE